MDQTRIDELMQPVPADAAAEIATFRVALKEESDRGCALIVASYIDVSLEALLNAAFTGSRKIKEGLLGTARPIGTFSARIDIGYCVGLLPERVYRDLHLIRKIRNEFAHAPVATTFQTPEVKLRCGELSCVIFEPEQGLMHARRRFVMSALGVLGYLHKSATSVPCMQVPVGPDFDEMRRLGPELLAEAKRRAE